MMGVGSNMTINHKLTQCEQRVKELEYLLYRAMHCLDNDFVPGPKFAKLWQDYTDLTGILEGDEYE